jgi:hypothetical protein
LPVVGSAFDDGATPAAAVALTALARALSCPPVAEFAHEKIDDLFDEALRLLPSDVGKLLELNLPRLATMPTIWLFGIGVNAVDDDLLSIAQKLDLLGGAARRDEVDDDLCKGLLGAERDRALRCSANAHQDVAALFVELPHVVLDGACRLFAQEVGVERGHAPR